MVCISVGKSLYINELLFLSSKAEFLGKETRDFIKDSNGKITGIKLTISGVTPENSARYECSATNSFGMVMDIASLTVNKVFGSGGGPSMDEEGKKCNNISSSLLKFRNRFHITYRFRYINFLKF